MRSRDGVTDTHCCADTRGNMTFKIKNNDDSEDNRKIEKILVSQVAAYQHFGSRIIACDRMDGKRNPSPRIKFATRPPQGSILHVCIVDARDISEHHNLSLSQVLHLKSSSSCILSRRKTMGKLAQALHVNLNHSKVKGIIPHLSRFMVYLTVAGKIVAAGHSFECFVDMNRQASERKRKIHQLKRAKTDVKAAQPQTNHQSLLMIMMREHMATLSPEMIPIFQAQMMNAVRARRNIQRQVIQTDQRVAITA